MIGAIQTALSGLNAASTRAAASASNIANEGTVGSLDGKGQAPYAPLETVQETAADGQGVTSKNIPNSKAFTPSYDPDSPFANSKGLVGAPDVDMAGEAVNLSLAKFAYKANVAVIRTSEQMQNDLLRAFDTKS